MLIRLRIQELKTELDSKEDLYDHVHSSVYSAMLNLWKLNIPFVLSDKVWDVVQQSAESDVGWKLYHSDQDRSGIVPLAIKLTFLSTYRKKTNKRECILLQNNQCFVCNT
jgi:hypothetical protein